MVAPSTLFLIRFMSSRLNIVASNILCGETAWLKRVKGTFLPLDGSEPSVFLMVSKMAGENLSRVLAILTGDWTLLINARFNTVMVEGARPGSSATGLNSIAGVPLASRSERALKKCMAEAPSIAA